MKIKFKLILLLMLFGFGIFGIKNISLLPIASNAQTLAIENVDQILEDNPPIDPFIPDDSSVLITANAIDSEPSTIATTKKPNIVVVMIDDVNPNDGRLWNQNITPAIYNTFIAKGIKFDNYYGETALCCPGRVSFLTGQHTQNHGVADLDGTKFKPDETIAKELQSAGYYTMLTGKYLNGYSNIPASKAIPPGWSKFDAIYEGQGKYINYDWISKNGQIKHYGEKASDYSTDVIANTAIQRLKEAPPNKPIFAFITPYASHRPKTPAPRHVGDPRCKNISSWKPLNYNELDVSDKPNYVRKFSLLDSKNGFELKETCETLLSVDDLVRRVKSELEKERRLENTVFIFTGDNGMNWGMHRLNDKTTPYSDAIPLYIRWSNGRGNTPRIESTTLSSIDLAPTLCEIGGCTMGPYPNGQTKPDGLSFYSLIKDRPVSWTRDSILENLPLGYATRPSWWGIRTTSQSPWGLWQYVEYKTGEKELYDISNGPCYTWNKSMTGDPCELNNLLRSGQNPSSEIKEIENSLSLRLKQLKKQKGDPLPTLTPTPTLSPTPSPSPTPTITPTPSPSPTP